MELTMEEEIQLLFRLSQPQSWRNSFCTFNDTNNEGQGSSNTAFWHEIGLGSYSQMDFDLSLTLNSSSVSDMRSRMDGNGTGGATGTAYNSFDGSWGNAWDTASGLGRGGNNFGGYLFNNQLNVVANSASNNRNNQQQGSTSSRGDEGEGGSGGMKVDIDGDQNVGGMNLGSIPPNDLYLANILRMTIDCPFSDIRKQAENVLFLLKVSRFLAFYIKIFNQKLKFINFICKRVLDKDSGQSV